jgi:hypothetical protein
MIRNANAPIASRGAAEKKSARLGSAAAFKPPLKDRQDCRVAAAAAKAREAAP